MNYSISLSGLMNAQRGLKVANNNIANAETDGYARQKIELSAINTPLGSGVDSQIGSGVMADKITRMKDDLLIQQSRTESGEVGYYSSLREGLTGVENIFGENSDGSITDLLGKFFNAWEEVTKFPEENSYRASLLGEAERLTTKFNSIQDGLSTMKKEFDNKIEVNVTKVNDLVNKIKDVNLRISKSGTEKPNALYDERDKYIDELSQFADVNVSLDNKRPNLMNVSVGGVNVVSGVEAREVEAMFDSTNEEWLIVAGNAELRLTSGKLISDVNMRNEHINNYENQVDEFVSSLVTEVNNIHAVGYGLDNSTGNPFFLGSNAGSIKVSSLLKDNPEKVGTSSEMDTPGNAEQARAIANLRDSNIYSGGTVNPMNFWNGLVVDMGMELNSVRESESIHESILMGIEEERQNVQGVNIDEEMSNLLKFQRFYAANAKALKTADETYQALLQMV